MKFSPQLLLALAAPFVVQASPLFDLTIGEEVTLPGIVEIFGVPNQNYVIKYEYNSRPGPGFFDFRDDLGISYNPDGADRSELVEANSDKRIEELRFNLNAFHLKSQEEMNGVVLNKERLLSEGLLVDYFPDRPSAYLRPPGYSRDKITLFDVLSQLPRDPSAVRNGLTPDGWSSVGAFGDDIVSNGEIRTTEDGFVLSFRHQFEELNNRGFNYQLHFDQGAVLGAYRLSELKVDIAHFREELGEWEVGGPFYIVHLNDYTSRSFPSEIKVDMWRSQRTDPSEPYKRYLVRQLMFDIDTFATTSLGNEDYSFHFSDGTTVMDELTGTRYRIGNPIDKLIGEVSESEEANE